jgi:UDP-N-acetylmuramoyl-tripeptide--D-alanyl-D-alanine ligase
MRVAEVSLRLEGMSVADIAAAVGARVEGDASRRIAGVSIDTRTLRPGELFAAIRGPRFDGHSFLPDAVSAGAAALLIDRDVSRPPDLPILRTGDATRALADLARHLREVAGVPVAAVTGSSGKTTTREMLAAMLGRRGPVLSSSGNLNNRYGVPLTLFRIAEEHRAVVLELGMSAPGELRELSAIARPDVAVITNVAAAHLASFASLREIALAKAEILEGLAEGGAAVLNREDAELRRIGERHAGEVLWFGRDRSCDVSVERWRGTIHGQRFDLRVGRRVMDVALPLPGPHFMWNFAAAAAAAQRLGASPDDIAAVAPGLRAAEHRGRVMRLGEDVTLLDDCYNSNPAAVEAAVLALSLAPTGRRIAVLGEMLELGPEAAALHERTGALAGPRLDVIVSVGELAAGFLRGAARTGLPGSNLVSVEDAAAAAAVVLELVRPGDAVLVKGSRGVHLEQVVEALVDRLGERGE